MRKVSQHHKQEFARKTIKKD